MKKQKEIIGRITISQRQGSPKRTSPKLTHQRSKTSKLGIPKNINRNRKNSNPTRSIHHNPRINPITQITKTNCESVRPPTGEKFIKIHRSLSPQTRMAGNHFLLPPKTSNKKTLVLDLDETMVRSTLVPQNHNDLIFQVNYILYNQAEIEEEIKTVYVNFRPHLDEFLQRVEDIYEVITFTASETDYANKVIDQIDKRKKIKYRLFRENCTLINGVYLKELKKLNFIITPSYLKLLYYFSMI